MPGLWIVPVARKTGGSGTQGVRTTALPNRSVPCGDRTPDLILPKTTMTDDLKPTLVDQARAEKPKKPANAREYIQEDAELAVAWAIGDVSLSAVGKTKSLSHGSSQLAYLAYSLREAFRLGLIKAVTGFTPPT